MIISDLRIAKGSRQADPFGPDPFGPRLVRPPFGPVRPPRLSQFRQNRKSAVCPDFPADFPVPTFGCLTDLGNPFPGNRSLAVAAR
jgi:hypothetical protein